MTNTDISELFTFVNNQIILLTSTSVRKSLRKRERNKLYILILITNLRCLPHILNIISPKQIFIQKEN